MESILITVGLLTILLWVGYWTLGMARIYLWNFGTMKVLRHKINNPETRESERFACQVILTNCNELARKWILSEKDLDIDFKTMSLIQSVAKAWNPQSTNPVLEVKLGKLFEAVSELNQRLLKLIRLQGFRSVTRFRIHHIFFLARAWEKKRLFEATPTIKFFRRTKLDFIIHWCYTAFRFFDLSFWLLKMIRYLIQDVFFKILLIHYYLTVGELAGNVYRREEEELDRETEPVLDKIEEVPDIEISEIGKCPEALKVLIRESRQKIMFNTFEIGWNDAREIYTELVRSIARHYYPDSKEPLYEASLFSILTSATRFSENALALESLPVIQKLFGVKLIYIIKVKDTTHWLSDSQIFNWIKEHDLHRVAKYAAILFKLIKRRHPGVLFKEFIWVMTKEGLKRWGLIYLHKKIANEARFVYSFKLIG